MTGRPVFLYYSGWLAGNASGAAATITLQDMQGFMEVCRDVPGPDLDLIVHSPGGSPEATASIVRYLRLRFTGQIRVFIPLAAMSAATMLALAGNRIVMGKHSQLGPIDPQLQSAAGWMAPARAILDQFERAKRECASDASVLAAWAPILQQYGPALLEQCKMAEALAKSLVQEWLAAYMFDGDNQQAAKTADFFANYELHLSHSLGIDRDQARAESVVVDNLEDDQSLQDAVLSVHHAAMLTPATKLIENHLGRTFATVQPGMSIGPILNPPLGGLLLPPGGIVSGA